MNRLGLIAALALAAACGGKGAAVTPAIRTAANVEANKAVKQSEQTLAVSAQVKSLGVSLGNAALAGDATGVDIAGIPAPAVPGGPAAPAILQGLARAPRLAGAAVGSASGCIIPDHSTGAQAARFVSAGTGGCSASDHVEINYLNGDQVEETFSGNQNSFTLRIRVVHGDWAGTDLTFTGDFATATGNSARFREDGRLLYSSTSNPAVINADIATSIDIESSQDQNGQGTSLSIDGSSTDRVNRRKVTTHSKLGINGSGSAGVVDWNGDATIDLLKADGITPENTVLWRGIGLHQRYDPSAAGTSVSFSAGGEVLWNGTVVGHILAKSDNTLVVHWDDGQETPFDPSTLLTPFFA